MAVCQIVDIYNNISDRAINKSWNLTGLTKFKNMITVEDVEYVNREQIEDDLNERLEELKIFEED